MYLFIDLGFYIAFNTIQVISRRVVGRAEETSTQSSLGLCTVNCRPTASNYQLSHLRLSRGSNPGLRGGRRERYHSATVAPQIIRKINGHTQSKSLVCECFMHNNHFFLCSDTSASFKDTLTINRSNELTGYSVFYFWQYMYIIFTSNQHPNWE